MNIEYVRTIRLRVLLSKMLCEPYATDNGKLFYSVHFNHENPKVLKVNTASNKWKLLSENTYRDGLELIRFHLNEIGKPNSVADALAWVKDNVGYAVLQSPKDAIDYSEQDKVLVKRFHSDLREPALLRYLENDRKIPLGYAGHLLQQVGFDDTETGTEYLAIGLKNDEGGWAIRNPYIKATVNSSYLSFIRGTEVKPKNVHIFKDVYDYLSMITIRKGVPLTGDAMILNGLVNLEHAGAYIYGYGYERLYSWLENSEIGKQASKNLFLFCHSERDLLFVQMNFKYEGFKDVNEWHIAQCLSETTKAYQ